MNGLTRRRLTAWYILLLIALGLSSALLGPAVPTLSTNTGSDTGSIAMVFFAKGFGSLVGAQLLGHLYDRFDGHKVMRTLLFLLLPVTAVIPLSGNLPVLLSCIVLNGILEGGLHVGSNVLLARLHGNNAGPYINALHFGFGAGATVAPLAISFTLEEFGTINVSYFAVGIFYALLALSLLLFASPDHDLTTEVSEQEVQKKRLPLRLVLITLIFTLYVGAEGGFSGWIYSYGLATGVASEVTAGILTSLFWGGLTLGRLSGILLARLFRAVKILQISMLSGAILLLLMALVITTIEGLMIVSFLFGLSIATIFPMNVTYASESMKLDGRATGLFFVGAATGGMSLPLLIGQLFDAGFYNGLPIVAGVSLGLGLILVRIVHSMQTSRP